MNGPAGSGELPESILNLYPGNPRFLWITGRLHVRLEQRNAAARTVSEARRSGDRRKEAEGLLTLSDGWRDLIDGWRERDVDAPDAVNFAREAAVIFRELHDNAGEARAYCALGEAWQEAGFNDELKEAGRDQEVGCYDQALADWQAAERLAGAAGNGETQARALEGIGKVLTHLGRNAEAVEKLRRSGELFRAAGDARGSGTAKSTLGLALLRLKRYDEAADACREAIALCRSARELDSMRTAQVNLSYALLRAGRYQELIAASGDALAACEEINYEDGVTSMLANLAFACLKEKQYDESVRRHKQLLERLPRQDHTQRAKANDNIGFALVAIEDVVAGAKFYQEAADEYAAVRDYRNAGIACLDAGEALVNANRSDESIVATGRAADLLAKSGDGENEARARVRLGQAYSLLERWDEGAKAFRDAASVSERCGDRAGRAFATTLLGGTLVDSGHPERALPYLEWAIEEGKRIENATVQRLASRFLGIAQVKLARRKGMGGSAR